MERMVGTLHELVYFTIVEYYDEHHYMPSTEEIAQIVGTSRNIVYKHLDKLFKEGRIETDEGKYISRAYRLT